MAGFLLDASAVLSDREARLGMNAPEAKRQTIKTPARSDITYNTWSALYSENGHYSDVQSCSRVLPKSCLLINIRNTCVMMDLSNNY